MNITAMIIIVFYFAIIIVPLLVVIRESLREISRLASETPLINRKGQRVRRHKVDMLRALLTVMPGS